MSHFTVLVIGKDVDAQLAPFHEFECTGESDQYVQEIDITEETREEYEKYDRLMLRGPNGEFEHAFSEQFYRDATQQERKERFHHRIRFVPEGWTEETVMTKTVQSFAEFVEYWHAFNTITLTPNAIIPKEFYKSNDYKFGWTELDENGNVLRVIRRTNPNAKWDWYQIGGRWTGFFQLKTGGKGSLGEPSLVALLDKDYDAPDPITGKADSARKGDIDVAAMRNEAEAKATAAYDKFHAIVGNIEFETWPTILERFKDDIDKARNVYHNQKVFELLRAAKHASWDIDKFFVRRDVFIQDARLAALSTFAVIKDGKWYERGEMGWWAIVSNEKDKDEWYRQFNELFDSIPDDEWVTVVDCHT